MCGPKHKPLEHKSERRRHTKLPGNRALTPSQKYSSRTIKREEYFGRLAGQQKALTQRSHCRPSTVHFDKGPLGLNYTVLLAQSGKTLDFRKIVRPLTYVFFPRQQTKSKEKLSVVDE